QYNVTAPYVGPSNIFLAITNRIRLQGFIVTDYYEMFNQFQENISNWIKDGKIKWKETIIQGLENSPKAFIGLFKGENFGKMLIKIAE
ncbi:MAG: NADP-dependent oxidoreductase, partial [Candidatus Nitrosocosmicus sp.]